MIFIVAVSSYIESFYRQRLKQSKRERDSSNGNCWIEWKSEEMPTFTEALVAGWN